MATVHSHPIPYFNVDFPSYRGEGRRFSNPVLHLHYDEVTHLQSRDRKLLHQIFQLQRFCDIRKMSDSLPPQRPWKIQGWTPKSKRGIPDLGGKALHCLFWVAMDTDLEKLSQKIDGFHTEGNEVLHLMQEQASILNISASNSKKNWEDINLLV